jgi:hypothetical protein
VQSAVFNLKSALAKATYGFESHPRHMDHLRQGVVGGVPGGRSTLTRVLTQFEKPGQSGIARHCSMAWSAAAMAWSAEAISPSLGWLSWPTCRRALAVHCETVETFLRESSPQLSSLLQRSAMTFLPLLQPVVQAASSPTAATVHEVILIVDSSYYLGGSRNKPAFLTIPHAYEVSADHGAYTAGTAIVRLMKSWLMLVPICAIVLSYDSHHVPGHPPMSR